MHDEIVRRADYGLELVDEFTQGPLVGTSQVAFDFVGSPPAGVEPTVFVVNRSRWVFEELGADVFFSIDAEHYHSRVIQTGVGPFPSVPAAPNPGALARVEMRPRTGYPFPPNVTRLVGLVRLETAFDAQNRIVPNATVNVTPIHDVGTSTLITTVTTEDGQYLVWFLPDLNPAVSPPWATSYEVTATATVDIGLGPTAVTGTTGVQPLDLQTFNAAPTIQMHP